MHNCSGAFEAPGQLMRPRLELSDIVRRFGAGLEESRKLSFEQRKALNDIVLCRTAALGGHVDVCDVCGHKRPAYNCCRNRNCPKCQWLASQRWLDRRLERVLPVHHFHVVFTLPSELRSLVMVNKVELFNLLFRSSSQALKKLGQDDKRLGAVLGITSVLHTCSRDLSPHPHLHCVVSGGGLSDDGRWVSTRPGFLLPVNVLSRLFRGIFLDALKRLYKSARLTFAGRCEKLKDRGHFNALIDKLYGKKFNVFCKKPFDGVNGHVKA